MNINEEVEQIIIRTVIKKGIDSVPKDLAFLNKFRIKELYFIGINGTSNKKKFIKIGLQEILSDFIVKTDFPLLRSLYNESGKSGVMEKLKKDNNYYRTFYKCIKHGK